MAAKLLIHCPLLVTNLSFPLLLLPLSQFHRTPTSPAVQGISTHTQIYLFHAVDPAHFPLRHLQLPLSPVFPLYLLPCMALVWPLLAITPVVWTAARQPEDSREAHPVITQPPPLSPLQPPRHTSALILCT